MAYAELQATSNFSFLRGASHPEELIAAAKALGLEALAITDRNSLAGLVRAHVAAKEHGLRFIPACRLDLEDGPALLAYPTDRAAYARLTGLLTTGNRRAAKGACHLWREDVAGASAGLILAVVAESVPEERLDAGYFERLKDELDAPLHLAASWRYDGQDRRRLLELDALAREAGTPLVATGDVLYHHPARRPLADVLACIREHVRLEAAGRLLSPHAERFLKPPREMARLFADVPEAVEQSAAIARACRFSLDELRYDYPEEPVPEGSTPEAHLEALARDGIRKRFPRGVPAKVMATLERELSIVAAKRYAPYFLTVHDIVRFARSRGILCQGRGSAANSLICYALGITEVDPREVDLLFERFVSEARAEPPDIDVDFEHERREEVIQYIYRRYGRKRAALAATTITYRMRSAIRDVGKVMGLSEDVVGALAGTVWGSHGRDIPDAQVREAGFDPEDPRFRQTLELAHELVGFPRHLSQHVGGFVLSRRPLDEIVPIQNAAMVERTVIEWNKDDLDALDMIKVDVLGLGMLSCLRRAFALLQAHHGIALDLVTLPRADRATYEMLARADSLGVFQVESRAQMSMLPRLRPREFYDLVVQVAIVRPGPIQGDMVHPYLRRRQGREAVTYPKRRNGAPNELEEVLKKTYGVPLFQEQAMRIAIVAAGFTPEEADRLRRSMAAFRHVGTIHKFQEKFIEGMAARGYERSFAEQCFNQIRGFADYGFPESHAASFALLVYASAWLKCHHPDVFACALLNAQPMGFYAPAQIVRDAREHGVEVREADVNHSFWDGTLEPAPETPGRCVLRLGFRQILGLREEAAERLVAARDHPFPRPYRDVEDLRARTGLGIDQIERLAEADAFRSTSLDRRQALWQARGLAKAADLPLFAHAEAREQGSEAEADLPDMPLPEHVVSDYQTLRMSLKAHPLRFLRDDLAARGVVPCRRLKEIADGVRVSVAGLVLVRQRPGSAKGVVFLTLEDETGIANAIIWPPVFERQRPVVMGARLMIVTGPMQKEDGVRHVVADRLEDASATLLHLSHDHLVPPLTRSDEVVRPVDPERDHASRLPPHRPAGHPREAKNLLPRSRDFH